MFPLLKYRTEVIRRYIKMINVLMHGSGGVRRYIKFITTNIVTKAFVHNANDLRSITLSYRGILTRARGMDMRSVALLIQASTQTGIKVSNSPRFIDG